MTDTSSDTAKSTGSTAERTLANRFADEFSIEDFGVVNDPGGTNVAANTTAYQAAITAAAGVARLRHRAGLTVFTTGLSIPSNLNWVLDGLLTQGAGSSGSLVTISGSYVRVSGIGTINGNQANTPAGSAGITTSGTPSNIIIEDVTVTNCVNWPFNLGGSGHRVRGGYFTNSGHSCEFIVGASNCHAEGLTITDINDSGFAFYRGSTDCSITGSRVTGCSAQGIEVLYGNPGDPATTRIVISNNICTYNGYGGIEINGGSEATPQLSYIDVIGNICLYNCQNSDVNGIYVNDSVGVRVMGNLVGFDYNASGCGISITSTVVRCVVSDNTIFDEGQRSPTGTGIIVNGSYILISNNYIYDDQTAQTTLHAITGTPGLGCVFLNNRFGKLIGTAFDVTLNTDTIVDQNNNEEGGVNIKTINSILRNLCVA